MTDPRPVVLCETPDYPCEDAPMPHETTVLLDVALTLCRALNAALDVDDASAGLMLMRLRQQAGRGVLTGAVREAVEGQPTPQRLAAGLFEVLDRLATLDDDALTPEEAAARALRGVAATLADLTVGLDRDEAPGPHSAFEQGMVAGVGAAGRIVQRRLEEL